MPLGFDIRRAIHDWWGYHATTQDEIDSRLEALLAELRRWGGPSISAQQIETDREAIRAFQALRNRMEMAQRPNSFGTPFTDPVQELRTLLQNRLYPELAHRRRILIDKINHVFDECERTVRMFQEGQFGIGARQPLDTISPLRGTDPSRLRSALIEAISSGQLTREELQALDIVTSNLAKHDRSMLTFLNLVDLEPAFRFPPYLSELVELSPNRNYLDSWIDGFRGYTWMRGASVQDGDAADPDPETAAIRRWTGAASNAKAPLVSILVLMKYGEYALARKFLKALKTTEGTELQNNIFAMLLMAAAHTSEGRAKRYDITERFLDIVIANDAQNMSPELRSIFDYVAAVLSTPENNDAYDTSTLDNFLDTLAVELRDYETRANAEPRARRGVEIGVLNFLKGYYRLQRELLTITGRAREVIAASSLKPLITHRVENGRMIIYPRASLDSMFGPPASQIILEMATGTAAATHEAASSEAGRRDPSREVADRMRGGAADVVRRRRGRGRRAYRRNPAATGRLMRRQALRTVV